MMFVGLLLGAVGVLGVFVIGYDWGRHDERQRRPSESADEAIARLRGEGD